VLDEDEPVEEVVVSLARIGFDDVQGFIRGMTEWIEEGRPVTTEATFDGETLPDSIQVLDVRAPGEWSAGHLEGAIHCYVPDLVKAIPATLDRTRPVYVGCSTGYRATIAAGWPVAGRLPTRGDDGEDNAQVDRPTTTLRRGVAVYPLGGFFPPVATKLTQSPWFLNTPKLCQPPFLH